MIEDKTSAIITEIFDLNLKEYFMHVTAEEDFFDGEGYFRAYSGIPNPNHNIFFQDIISEDNLDTVIDETIAYFTEKKVPFNWWVSDETLNEELQKKLISRKFRYFGEVIGLAGNLADLEKKFDTPNALYTESLKDNVKLEEWSRIAAINFGLKTNQSNILIDKMKKYDFSDSKLNIKKNVSLLSGEVVSVSTTIYSNGVAAIHDDETVPYYAKYDGFKFAVIYYPLKAAQKKGYKVGITFADTKRINAFKIFEFEEKQKYHKFVYVPRRR